MDNWIEFLVPMKGCIDDSSIHLVVDSTVRFDVAPAKSAHYISMAHRPCGAWVAIHMTVAKTIKGGTNVKPIEQFKVAIWG